MLFRSREAARAAGAEDFIEQLEEKYDTVLEEGGGNLSGGEKQRISVARAFLKKAPILIMDEGTSALDQEKENVVIESLEKLREKALEYNRIADRPGFFRESLLRGNPGASSMKFGMALKELQGRIKERTKGQEIKGEEDSEK